MVVYEEIFQFAYEFRTQIFDVTNVGESVVIPLDGHDAVIAFRVFLLALFSLDNSHPAALQEAADGAGFIHEREHIDRVSILRYRRWDKAKIVREGHACGQHLFQSKDFLLFVKRIFISATFRCLDHHLQTAFFCQKAASETHCSAASTLISWTICLTVR